MTNNEFNEEDRIVLQRVTRHTTSRSVPVRVSQSLYIRLADISTMTGISLCELVSKLLAFSLGCVEIVDPVKKGKRVSGND